MAEVITSDPNTILTIDDLKTWFFLDSGTVKAVDGVNLTLRRNETLGLVGESGCGKSITAMSIMRLIKTPPGKIVDGLGPYATREEAEHAMDKVAERNEAWDADDKWKD